MEKRLFRNEFNKVIAGVSSGTADYMEVDVTIIRLLFVLSTIFLFGTGILVYLVMWIVVPVNNDPAARYSKFDEYFRRQNTPSPFGTANTFNQAENTGPIPTGDWNAAQDFKPLKKRNETGRTVGGLFLLVIGLYFLMNEFHIIPYWFRLGKLWPLVFVAIGISFIMKAKRKNAFEDWKEDAINQDLKEKGQTETKDI
ncbi:MAG: PspC domain protein [Pedobacter sp.]|jgi:phage shock protein C|nr:PspC domain protein [Pedobacter sp.]